MPATHTTSRTPNARRPARGKWGPDKRASAGPLTIPIGGMTCRSCEERLTKKIRRVPGVVTIKVSLRSRSAVVTGRPDRAAVQAAIEGAGYTVGASSWVSRDRNVWRDVSIAAGVVGVIAAVAVTTGLTDLSSRVGSSLGSGGVFVAVLLGLVAGFSTCMALAGGLVLAVAARHAERHPDATARQRMRPHLAFNAGRVVGFAALGAVLGALGSAAHLSGPSMGVALGIAGLAMLVVGLQLTGAFPRFGTRLFTLPPALSARLGLDERAGRYSDRAAVLAGIGSFFLPCGFTQAVQLYALSSGRPATAASLLGLFALGTTPGLLGLGGVAARGRSKRFFRFAGVVVVAFAVVNLLAAVTTLAPGLFASGGATRTDAISSNVRIADGVQIVSMVQDGGYKPANTVVYAGMPVRWMIDSRSIGCDTSLQVPSLGIDGLKPGRNEFTFTPAKPGRTHFACAMGMYRGSITMIPKPVPAATPTAVS